MPTWCRCILEQKYIRRWDEYNCKLTTFLLQHATHNPRNLGYYASRNEHSERLLKSITVNLNFITIGESNNEIVNNLDFTIVVQMKQMCSLVWCDCTRQLKYFEIRDENFKILR